MIISVISLPLIPLGLDPATFASYLGTTKSLYNTRTYVSVQYINNSIKIKNKNKIKLIEPIQALHNVSIQINALQYVKFDHPKGPTDVSLCH